jgi:hypothetical protein
MANATVLPPSTINVRVGSANPPVATAISYGQTARFELKNATDLIMSGAQNGDTIVYVAGTNSFIMQAPGSITNINGGEY